jgi:hypothetical protein
MIILDFASLSQTRQIFGAAKISKNQENEPSSINVHWRIYLLVGITTLAIALVMGYSLYNGNIMAVRYAPLVDAAMEIKFEVTIAHLWFEEMISGDRTVDIEDVWGHLDQSRWYAEAMLEGGENPEGKFVPL